MEGLLGLKVSLSACLMMPARSLSSAVKSEEPELASTVISRLVSPIRSTAPWLPAATLVWSVATATLTPTPVAAPPMAAVAPNRSARVVSLAVTRTLPAVTSASAPISAVTASDASSSYS